MWGWNSVETLWQDLRYGLRMLAKNPGFSVVAVLTLSLGIGVTASLLTVCRATILQPLSVPQPDQVVRLFFMDDQTNNAKFPLHACLELKKGSATVFAGLAAYHDTDVEIGELSSPATPTFGAGHALPASAALVTANYFTLFGGRTILGRTFAPDEDQATGAHPVTVLSYAFWQRGFGGDAGVLGRTIAVNGHPFTVIGVATPDFHGTDPAGPDIWVPLGMQHEVEPGFDGFKNEQRRWLYLVGRLRTGVRLEQAQASMRVVAGRWAQQSPEEKNPRILVTTGSVLNAESRSRILPVVGLAFFAVGLVLMIACANAANLLLVRALSRQRELSVRLALGASRSRLVRQLLTESAILSLLGGTGGLLLSQWTTTATYLAMTHAAHRSPVQLDFRVDGWVVATTMLVSLATAILFGLAPSLQGTRLNLVPALKEEGSTLHERVGASRLRSVLVVGQVALSLVLLVAAGLFIRALARSESLDLGFNAKNLLVLTADLQQQGYTPARAGVFYETLKTRLASIPGVMSVSLARVVPASDLYLGEAVQLEGQEPTTGNMGRVTFYDIVSPNYFASMQIPLVRGRGFSAQDARDGSGVVVNETFVRRFLGGTEPIGIRIRLGEGSLHWVEILGVVKDTMHGRPGEPAPPLVFHPLTKPYPQPLSFLVRTAEDPRTVTAAIPGEVRALDPQLSISISTMQQATRAAMWPAEVGALLASVLGGLAITLAAVGLIGVVAYNASQRTREVGIRIALGASATQVFGLILRQTVRLVFAGTIVGLIGAAMVSRTLSAFLFGLSPWDPLAFASCASLLTVVALIASYIPARRATKIDPMVALRYE